MIMPSWMCLRNWHRDPKGLSVLFLAVLSLQLVEPPIASGQEIAFLDLSKVSARTELRHPPVPEAECRLHHMSGFSSDRAAPGAVPD